MTQDTTSIEFEQHPIPPVTPVELSEQRGSSAWRKVRSIVANTLLVGALLTSAAYESTQSDAFPDGAAEGCQPDYDDAQPRTMAELRDDVASTRFASDQQVYDMTRNDIAVASDHEQIDKAMDFALEHSGISYIHNKYFDLNIGDLIVPRQISRAKYIEADLVTAKKDALLFLHDFKNIPQIWIDQLGQTIIVNNVMDYSDIMHRGQDGVWADPIVRSEDEPYEQSFTVNTRKPSNFRSLLIQQLAERCGIEATLEDIDDLDMNSPVAAMLRGLTPGLDSIWQYALVDHGQMILSDRAAEQSATVDCLGTNKDLKWIEVAVPHPELADAIQTIRVAFQVGQGLVSYVYGYDAPSSWSKSRRRQFEQTVMDATTNETGGSMQPTTAHTMAIRFGDVALRCRSFEPASRPTKR